MTIKEIKEREVKAIERYSKFIELVANSEVESAIIVDDILIENNSIPIIVTDSDGNIIEYKNISEPSESNLFDQLGSMKKDMSQLK